MFQTLILQRLSIRVSLFCQTKLNLLRNVFKRSLIILRRRTQKKVKSIRSCLTNILLRKKQKRKIHLIPHPQSQIHQKMIQVVKQTIQVIIQEHQQIRMVRKLKSLMMKSTKLLLKMKQKEVLMILTMTIQMMVSQQRRRKRQKEVNLLGKKKKQRRSKVICGLSSIGVYSLSCGSYYLLP